MENLNRIRHHHFDKSNRDVEQKSKDGVPVFYYKKNLFTGIFYNIHKNGKIAFEVEIKNGKMNGKMKQWFEGGELQSETIWKNGKIDGVQKIFSNPRYGDQYEEKVIYWDNDKILKSKELTDWGGVYEYFFKENIAEGKDVGIQKYYENDILESEGKVTCEYVIRPWQVHLCTIPKEEFGLWKEYNEKGKLKREVLYNTEENIRNGEDYELGEKVYDENGKVISDTISSMNKLKKLTKEVFSNKEFKNSISEFSNINHTSEIYFHLKKYAGFRKTEFFGDYKGYDFIIHGKLCGKWYEMTEPYDSNLKKFLQEIGDNEINKLDDKLFIDCQIETDFSLEGGKIEWSNKVTEEIKKEFEEEYGPEGDDGRLLNECEWDSSGNLEFYEPYNNITSIEIKIKEKEKETLVNWKNKN